MFLQFGRIVYHTEFSNEWNSYCYRYNNILNSNVPLKLNCQCTSISYLFYATWDCTARMKKGIKNQIKGIKY